MRLNTIFENKTQNVTWKLPYKYDGLKSFELLPGHKKVLELEDDTTLYAPFEKIVAKQSRQDEKEYRYKIELKKRKNWKQPLGEPNCFYTEFRNNSGNDMVQRFWLSENLIIAVPFGIPITVEMDPSSHLVKYEIIEKREISRRIIRNQDQTFVDAKSKSFYTRRGDKEMKKLFDIRRKINEGLLSKEFLKYA